MNTGVLFEAIGDAHMSRTVINSAAISRDTAGQAATTSMGDSKPTFGCRDTTCDEAIRV
ncbi:MAG: hypothetical protein ACYCSF_11405 [Acidimicrobiales bacterium]